jgi:hypothetical protein
MTLTDVRLSGLNNDLLTMRRQIADIRNQLRTYSIALGTPAGHEREILLETAKLHPKLKAFGPRLKEIASQVPELSTKTHRSGNTSTFGHLGNLRGTLPLVERDLTELQRELKTVHGQVDAVMKDPRRTASPAAGADAGAVVLLTQALDTTLEIVTWAVEWFKKKRG